MKFTVNGSVALFNAELPTKGSTGAAGYDLRASEDFVLEAGKTIFVGTGVYLELPENVRAMVYPRSGFATKNDIIIPNAPGLIDSDYRGEVKVALHKLTPTWYQGRKGDRIAQLVFAPVLDWDPFIKSLDELQQTSRGAGGFGSTGK